MKYDPTLQNVLLCAYIADEKWVTSTRNLLSEDVFDDAGRQEIARVVLSFYDKHGTLPSLEVLNHQLERTSNPKQAREALSACLASDISDGDIAYVEENYREYALLHRYRESLYRITECIEANDEAGARASFEEATIFAFVDDEETELRLFDPEDVKKRVKRKELSKISTLFSTLDNRLDGGVCRKELAFFLAPPNRGKSHALINMGKNYLLQGMNVLHVSVEMSKDAVASRYDNSITGMTWQQRKANVTKFEKAIANSKKLYKGELFIKEFPPRSISVSDIEAYMRKKTRSTGVNFDVLVLDYADELRRPRTKENTSYAIGDTYAELRAFASNHNMIVWTASQTTKTGLNKPVLTMDDVADSWDKMKVADVVIAECQTDEEFDKDEMRWVVLKLRDGKKVRKPVLMSTDFARSQFKELN